jgi:hypothetical protein
MSTANQLIYTGGTVAIDTTGDVITLKNVAGGTAAIISNAQVLLSRDGNDVLSQNATTTYLCDNQGNTVLSASSDAAVSTSGVTIISRAGNTGNEILRQTNTQTILSDPDGDAVLKATYNGTIASNTLTLSRGGHNNILTQNATDTYLYDSNEREILRTYKNTVTNNTSIDLYRDGDSNLVLRKTPTTLGLYDDSEECPILYHENDASATNFFIDAGGKVLSTVRYPDMTKNTFELSRCGNNKILTQDINDTKLYDSTGGTVLNLHYDGAAVENNTLTISRGGTYNVFYQDKSQTDLYDSNGDNYLIVTTDSNNTGNNTVTINRPGENRILFQNQTTTTLYNSQDTAILSVTTSTQTLLASALTLSSCPATTTGTDLYIKAADGTMKTITIAALKTLLGI